MMGFIALLIHVDPLEPPVTKIDLTFWFLEKAVYFWISLLIGFPIKMVLFLLKNLKELSLEIKTFLAKYEDIILALASYRG